MMNKLRCAAASILAAVILAASGCSGSATPTPASTPPERPQVTAAPGKLTPPDAQRFVGYTVKLKPAIGPELILKEPVAAQLIMDAFSSERLQVNGAVGNFNNKLEILDPDGKAEYSFTLSSDGQLLLKTTDGKFFRMPEYIYYLLEQSLWDFGGSLMDSWIKWQTEKGTAELELELPGLLKTAMLPAFGYSMAYFCTYKIYGVNTSTRDTAKVYLLMTYAGYDISGTSFSPNTLYTTPATLIFAKVSNGVWRLTGLKQPPVTKEKNDLYTNVRTIFPYDYMDDVIEDLKDTSAQVKDIARQATEYLNESGISGLTVES
jgi:hypothetical protein